MSDRAAQAITNAVRCVEYAKRNAVNDDEITAAYRNARQALAYAEAQDDVQREQLAVIRRLRDRIPNRETTSA